MANIKEFYITGMMPECITIENEERHKAYRDFYFTVGKVVSSLDNELWDWSYNYGGKDVKYVTQNGRRYRCFTWEGVNGAGLGYFKQFVNAVKTLDGVIDCVQIRDVDNDQDVMRFLED